MLILDTAVFKDALAQHNQRFTSFPEIFSSRATTDVKCRSSAKTVALEKEFTICLLHKLHAGFFFMYSPPHSLMTP
jgi:hypothetical protein